LAWFVLDVVERLDLEAIFDEYRSRGVGRPAHDPRMMVALLLYSYSVGERSARRIERRCVEDVAYPGDRGESGARSCDDQPVSL